MTRHASQSELPATMAAEAAAASKGGPSTESGPGAAPASSDAKPKQIGPYRILQRLGEGGLGEVFLADQQEPIQRKVALKVIKAEMNSPEVAARFEAEIRAISILDHPSITKVLDAGMTDDGRPYFVMEYVPGISITEYCDRNRLSIARRLQIFIKVCHAIHHAHQKAIIHRDIKAQNVLVAVVDGQAVPKVIDFGIVKAIARQGTRRNADRVPAATLHGQLIGTPEYMSPEQAEMAQLPVDTRSDVYSLGVLLYELLVGTLPLEPQVLRQSGNGAIPRLIRQIELPPMLQRLEQLGDQALDIAHRRSTSLRNLRRALRDDLQWIASKAMEKDATRRYASASELAADLERHLNREPVEAAPPSVRYRMGRFVRRHRPVVIAAGIAVIAVLVAFFEVTTGLLLQRRARLEAQAEVRRADAVLDHLLRTVQSMEPSSPGQPPTAQAILGAAGETVGQVFAGQPDVEAVARRTLGRLYAAIGDPASSEQHLRRALVLRKEVFGPQSLPALESALHLASLLLAREQLEESELLLNQVVQTSRQRFGAEHEQTIEATFELSRLRARQGRHAEAAELCREAIQSMEQADSRDSWTLATYRRALGECLIQVQDYASAETELLTSMAEFKSLLGDRHPQARRGAKLLAELYGRWNKPEKAAQFDAIQ